MSTVLVIVSMFRHWLRSTVFTVLFLHLGIGLGVMSLLYCSYV